MLKRTIKDNIQQPSIVYLENARLVKYLKIKVIAILLNSRKKMSVDTGKFF